MAKNQHLDALVKCAGLGNALATGQYSLAADVTARGVPAELSRSLQGHIQFNAANGRLYRLGVAGRVLCS